MISSLTAGGVVDGAPASASAVQIAEWFDRLLASSANAIGVISVLENRYVRANDALLELYGMTREELFASDPFTMATRMAHPDDLISEQKLFSELVRGARHSYRIEKRFVRPDGSVRWGLTTLSGWFLPSDDPARTGPLSWVIIDTIDITEKKLLAETLQRREAEFRHAQKIDALGRLAAGIAHDFNNLLTVISGHAEVLKEGLARPDSQPRVCEMEDDLAAILAAADRAAALTAQLLTHGRREHAGPRAFVLSELAATLQRLLRRTLESNVEVQTALRAEGAIFADQGQVGQVVMNLMLNARDALGKAGRIRLETWDVEATAPDAVPGPGTWVALSVADNGHGMTAEVQARMFEPFFTTRSERPGVQGNGLGLATVQRIVAEAHGQIDVQSAPGQGTTVTVYFPRAPAAAAVARSVPPPLRSAPNSRRILVIEDEPAVRALVGTVLLGAHYRVSVARDGAEGLRMIEAEQEPFHLVVTDLMMPEVGGVALALHLQQSESAPRLLFISGYSPHTPAELLALGSFLPKPFTPAQLLAAVAEALSDAS